MFVLTVTGACLFIILTCANTSLIYTTSTPIDYMKENRTSKGDW